MRDKKVMEDTFYFPSKKEDDKLATRHELHALISGILQVINGIQVKHFLPSLRRFIDTPHIGK